MLLSRPQRAQCQYTGPQEFKQLIGLNRTRMPEQIERAVHSVVREIQQSHPQGQSSGGLTPHAHNAIHTAFETCAEWGLRFGAGRSRGPESAPLHQGLSAD